MEEKINWKKIVRISSYPYNREACLLIEDSERKSMRFCNLDYITDVVVEGAKIEIEKPIGPRERSDIRIYFKNPTACEVRDRILRCPTEAKMGWEIESEKRK